MDEQISAATDEELYARFSRRHQEQAFEILSHRYRNWTYRIAFGVAADEALAEEAVQEVFLRLTRESVSFQSRGEGSFRAWLGVLTLNVTRTCMKIEMRKRQLSQKLRSEENTHVSLVGAQSGETSSADEESLLKLRNALSELSEDLRLPLVLHFMERMSQSEIGALVGISQSLVSRRIAQGLELLRKRLSAEGVSAIAVPAMLSQPGFLEAPASLVQALSWSRLSARMADAGARASRRVVALKTGAFSSASGAAWVFAALAALGFAGIWWLSWPVPQAPAVGSNPTAPPMPAQPLFSPPEIMPAPDVTAKSKDEPFYRRWTFEKGPPGDIEVRDGAWRWDGKKHMVVDKEMAVLLLPIPLPRKPFLVQTRLATIGMGNSQSGSGWCDGDGLLPFRNFSPDSISNIPPGKPLVYQEYFIGSQVITFCNDHVRCISDVTRTTAASRLYLGLYRMEVEEILLKSLDESEIPADMHDPRALIAKLGWTAKEIGAQPFPPRSSDNR